MTRRTRTEWYWMIAVAAQTVTVLTVGWHEMDKLRVLLVLLVIVVAVQTMFLLVRAKREHHLRFRSARR